eukprot:gnl/TRDRNA2_/TRDRNA2_191564_c0_seq1.p1 gnl/TRDRNA2_/TRDRNA2_191564_c0~~gnl/TRDRNA2_/TRDRNA2_191564_c0_seq1.p1  ORF type:complete len:467 (+),score=150.65 gnl/TRDRNA2_/TRDRNA2_191564_c0_seq1:75-1475(+)
MSIQVLIKEVQAVKKGGDEQMIMQAYHKLTKAYITEGSYDKALESASNAKSFAAKAGKAEQVDALQMTAHVHLADQNTHEAKKVAAEALTLAEGDQKLMATSMQCMAMAEVLDKDKSQALDHAKKAVKLMKESGDDSEQADALRKLVEIQLECEDDLLATLGSCQGAMSLYKKENNRKGQGLTAVLMAEVNLKRGDKNMSKAAANEGVALMEKEGDLDGLAAAHLIQAKLSASYNDLAVAAKSAKKAIELYTAASDWQGWAKAQEVATEVSVSKGDHAKARRSAQELSGYYRSIGKTKAMLANMLIMATESLAEMKSGSSQVTVQDVNAITDETEKMCKAIEDFASQAQCLIVKANMQLHKGAPAAAMPIAKEAADVGKKSGDCKAECDALACLAHCHLNRGQSLGAYPKSQDDAKTQFDLGMKVCKQLRAVASAGNYDDGMVMADDLTDANNDCRDILGLAGAKK